MKSSEHLRPLRAVIKHAINHHDMDHLDAIQLMAEMTAEICHNKSPLLALFLKDYHDYIQYLNVLDFVKKNSHPAGEKSNATNG